jgi:hypothetical protein
MEMIALTPECKAGLDEYARRRGQHPAVALDEVLAAWLEEERQDYRATVRAIARIFGPGSRPHATRRHRMQPADMVMERLRAKHAVPG